ncbi:hypothetical protein [Dokdonella ginsengisoli]|uniref:LPXTG cell wall anchor domain-containing protein n=1 Tax=Dokdonella ginsengisoli TaxID=363846 RepID=A0ABV9R1U8_9GAMM
MSVETTTLLLLLGGALFLLVRYGRRAPAAVRVSVRPRRRR